MLTCSIPLRLQAEGRELPSADHGNPSGSKSSPIRALNRIRGSLRANAQVLWSRSESSQGRAVFPSRVVSSRHPLAPPALPCLHATMGASDFRAPPTVSSLLTFVHGCPLLPVDRRPDLLGYRLLATSGSMLPRPRLGTRTRCGCYAASMTARSVRSESFTATKYLPGYR